MVIELTAYAYVYCQTRNCHQNDQHLQHTTNVTTFYDHLVLNVTFSKKKRTVY
jgi:hypothetical protein